MPRSIHKLILLFVLFVSIFSQTLIAENSQSKVRPQIIRIAKKLSKSSSLHLGLPVGISGTPETSNKYYKLFLKLQKLATDSELVYLTNNNSKNVVIYSFIALSNRNYNGLKEIFFKHSNDSSTFSISGGCTGSIEKVNSFMLNSLQPIQPQGSLNHLTEEEYQFFLKRINN